MEKIETTLKGFSIQNMMKIPWNYSKRNVMINSLLSLINGLLPVIRVIIVARLLDMIILYIRTGTSLGMLIILFFLLIILEAFKLFIPNFQSVVRIKMENKLRETFKPNLILRISNLEYKYFEDKDKQDLFHRVLKDCEIQVTNQYFNLVQIITILIEIFGLIFVLATNVWWSAITIIIFSVPLFSLAIKSGKANYQAKRDVSNEERKSVYFNELMIEREYVDEKNIFDFSQTIAGRYINAYEIIRKQKNKVEIDWFFKMKISGILVLLFACMSAAMLAFPAVEGLISIGLYISLVNAISSLSQVISWQLTTSLDQLAQDSEYIHDLNQIDGLDGIELDKHENSDLDLAEFESLEFKNVWFKYPGTEEYILKGISFKILRGKHYSFVGKNGCGKTTISKLILGLYNEYDGEILYNNVSYKKIDWSKKRKIGSAVFQDFSKFPVSIRDNIFFGKKYNQSNLNKIIYSTDLQTLLEKLPNGIETNLSKLSVEGIDISGGEWQKIAISRCLALETDIKILDEPTASLDPLVENKIYEQFGNIVQNKTSIFISHRLGSTKLADTIFVIDNGKILEEGSHETLMEYRAAYYNMYVAQKEWYVIEKGNF